MEPAPDSTPTVARQSGQRLWAIVLIIMTAMIVVPIIIDVSTRSYIDLSPDRTNDEFLGALLVGFTAMVATIAALIYYRPKPRLSLAVGALMFSAIAFVTGFMIGILPMMVVFKVYDFRERPMTGFDAYLRVARFHQTQGRGAGYRLELADFNAEFDLYNDDYRWNAGHSKDLAVTGKCIHVHLEKSGQALRMIQPEHVHAVPCPADPKLLRLG